MAYYCQALKLSPSNMRALFGLYLVSFDIDYFHDFHKLSYHQISFIYIINDV